ncbi:hypothetical protein ACQPYE_25655 [Actinosynnema sp. CA-299493]
MTGLSDLVVGFARTGRLGPLRCGMTLDEVQDLLGPFHGRMDDRKPRRWRPRLHFWDDLEVVICHGMVVTILVPAWRDTLRLPHAVSGWRAPHPAVMSYDDVLEALATAGCSWRDEEFEGSSSDDGSRSIRTAGGEVSLSFWRDGDATDPRLYKAIKVDHSVDQGDHSPRQGPARTGTR